LVAKEIDPTKWPFSEKLKSTSSRQEQESINIQLLLTKLAERPLFICHSLMSELIDSWSLEPSMLQTPAVSNLCKSSSLTA